MEEGLPDMVFLRHVGSLDFLAQVFAVVRRVWWLQSSLIAGTLQLQ
jgi:hypothetical protein